jgi:hypothetical protein
MDPDDVRRNPATWERVLVKLRAGEMPPSGRQPRPNGSAVSRFSQSLREQLDRVAAAAPDPGRPVIHRLNRVEYRNVVRDLIAVDIDVTSQLPADDSGYGFDNIADILSMSPALFERYMSVAESAARLAVADPSSPRESRQKIFLCQPSATLNAETCAREILSNLARRAYRRPVTASDIGPLLALYRSRAPSFERGIELALQAMLVSPSFLFRIERDPPGADAVYRVSDVELASRLSFFLWSSMPDGELLDLAEQNRLRDPAVLDKQVRRMIADPRSNALTENFAGQWLYLRNLRTQVPNSLAFPDFDDNLRRAFQTETELFFESVMREDRNVLDLMTADYTFLNERLARHYDVPNVMGSHFRRVKMTGTNRRGLLGHGSVLMVSSHTDRTSPVVRGKWILDNLMGAPPPPPPVNVPPLKENEGPGTKVQTLRERLEEHRGNPTCAACHKLMDPIGFALENFDAVGAYRTRDGGTLGPVIDASGQLMDGTRVDGVATLRDALVRQPEIFVGTFTEKLMTYALGRGVGASDMPVVRAILRDAARQNYRFSAIVQGIVGSAPFQMRTSAPAAASPESTSARR